MDIEITHFLLCGSTEVGKTQLPTPLLFDTGLVVWTGIELEPTDHSQYSTPEVWVGLTTQTCYPQKYRGSVGGIKSLGTSVWVGLPHFLLRLVCCHPTYFM